MLKIVTVVGIGLLVLTALFVLAMTLTYGWTVALYLILSTFSDLFGG